MADIHWYMICDKATGAAYSLASIDYDDPDIAWYKGQPYIKPRVAPREIQDDSGLIRKETETEAILRLAKEGASFSPRGLSHPEQMSFKGMEAHELTNFDNDGSFEWDSQTRGMKKRDMAVVKQRQLAAAEAEVARLKSELGI